MRKLTPIERMGCIVSVGAVLIGMVYYSGESSGSAESSTIATAQERKQVMDKPTKVTNNKATNKPPIPTLPTGYLLSTTRRDPFAVPIEYQPKNNEVGKNNSLTNVPSSTPSKTDAKVVQQAVQPQAIQPILVGVVSGNDTYRAIIQYGADSRTYRIGENVGPYQLIAISDKAIILSGVDGNVALAMGR